MTTTQKTCGLCAGTGIESRFVITEIGGFKMRLEKREQPCSCCGGKGYQEFAMFTVEEAERILKHCCQVSKE